MNSAVKKCLSLIPRAIKKVSNEALILQQNPKEEQIHGIRFNEKEYLILKSEQKNII